MAAVEPDVDSLAASDSPNTTFFLPKERDRKAGKSSHWVLPADLQRQATGRLRLIAITYSAVFFLSELSDFLAATPKEVAYRFEEPYRWMPSVVSILGGLLVAILVSSRRLSWNAKVNLGLVFEVLASYGIAIAMYSDLTPVRPWYAGPPSWVGIWLIFYAVVVPTPPGRALLALVASACAIPVVIWLALQQPGASHVTLPRAFFFQLVFAYTICVALAYVGARTVFKLGRDVSRARELGSYRLVERLGKGGMGEVWKASHQLLAREAAIKFIRADRAAGSSPDESRRLLKRFELEAHTTASLTSEHTIDLYDFGITDEGSFYYVMELLDGLDCDSLVRRFGPLPAARTIFLLSQVCESLEEAHAKGLIHRDVKPANIYVCRSGTRFDFVKVLDFGLVAHHDVPVKPEIRLTMPEQTVGTPDFMAPELALGQAADGRADLYALGCVAYWLLTGQSVFAGSSIYEVISNHLHKEPERPSRLAPAAVPGELDALILECLEKDPARRPADARELRSRLRDIPLAAPWSDEQAAAWWAAHLESSISIAKRPG